jgi:subtilisin family serine protease
MRRLDARAARRTALSAVATLAALAACSDDPVRPEQDQAAGRPALATAPGTLHMFDTVPNLYGVGLTADVLDVPATAQLLVDEQGGTLHLTWDAVGKGFSATLSPEAADALRRKPEVWIVEPVTIVGGGGGTQARAPAWGLNRIDQRGKVGADSTYGYARSGLGVTIYIVDSGVDTLHPDFGDRVSQPYVADAYTNDTLHWHGTHVAGVAGGRRYGVAKDVKLVSVRVLNQNNRTQWDTLVAGLNWIRKTDAPARAGRKVVNLSIWGSTSRVLDAAVDSLIKAGMPVVTIAGNNKGENACDYSPSRLPAALTVGATWYDDWRWVGSNIGKCIDLFAPGGNIRSTRPGGGADTSSGTSFAAPHVAGAAARYIEGFPNATPQEVTDSILYYATRDSLYEPSLGTESPNLLLYRTPWTENLGEAHLLVANSGYCLHVYGGRTGPNEKIIIAECDYSDTFANQRWTLPTRGTSGAITVYTPYSWKKCLGVRDADASGTRVLATQDCVSGATGQQWTLTRRGEFRWSGSTGTCAGIAGKSTAELSDVILAACDDGLDQLWDPNKH